MFGKIFSSMFEGSMMGKGSEVFALWTWVLSHADKTGHLEVNPKLAAAQIGMDAADAERILEEFCKPDPQSRTPDNEGRKMERLGVYLFRVVNYEKYLNIRNREQRKEQVRTAVANLRAKRKRVSISPPLPGERAYVEGVKNGTIDKHGEPIKTVETNISGNEVKPDVPYGTNGEAAVPAPEIPEVMPEGGVKFVRP